MNAIVLTQNVKLDSLASIKRKLNSSEKTLIITTQYLFENERAFLMDLFGECEFKCFADFLTDEEMSYCDTSTYTPGMEYTKYENGIRRVKNELVIQKVIDVYNLNKKYILSDDLGVDECTWRKHGFRRLRVEYYHDESRILSDISTYLYSVKWIRSLYYFLMRRPTMEYATDEVQVAYYAGRKIIFIGKMHRIKYRLGIEFEESPEELQNLCQQNYHPKDECLYMTTWHEHSKCNIPDDPMYDVRWSQDGYLPPNYTDYDYHFKPENVKYYCWDYLGSLLFENQRLPYEMIPFRKKLYLPAPRFPGAVRNILVVASGSGDWTAMKNRSDDDIMVAAFVEMARRFPNIHFTYRCHPSWVHPRNVGVNAINRVAEYINSVNLPNIMLSSNVPASESVAGFQLTYSRSSLEEDLKNADFVFGEHSISMIDAAFDGIPFSSVNLTRRRNFFIGINDLGFPTCSSYEDIIALIGSITTPTFQTSYMAAVDNYNRMTDIEI